MLPIVCIAKTPKCLALKQIRPLLDYSKAYRTNDHAKHLHSHTKTAVFWTQAQLDNLRTLFADGKRIADVAVKLKKTIYSVHAVARWDHDKRGWWTPERPVDIPEFRKQNKPRVVDGETAPVSQIGGGRKRRPWEQSDDDRAFEMVNSGVPLEDIAAALGRTVGAVRTRLNRAQNGPGTKPFSAEEDANILSLRTTSRSTEELRELMPRRSEEDIRRRAAALGVSRHIKAKPWTREELVKLWRLRATGMAFSAIARHFPERTTSGVSFKYRATPEDQRPTAEEMAANAIAEDN